MFERALVPEPAAGHKRSFNSFIAAVAGHGLVIGALLAVGALAVQATNDPDVADYALSFIAPAPPPPAPPAPHRPYVVQQRPEVRETPKPREVELPKVQQPKEPVVTAQVQPKLQMLEQTPEPEQVAATRPAEPEKPQIAAGGYGKLAATMDAPEVKVPGGGRGGPGLPAREPGLEVGDGPSSIVAYHSDVPAAMGDLTVPAPGTGNGRPGGKRGGGPAGLLTVPGNGVGGGSGTGGAGINYGDVPGDAPGGPIGGYSVAGRGGRGTGSGLGVGGGVGSGRAGLASRYGLPLVSVNALGARSTEAARWNLLLPRIADLLRQAVGGSLASHATGNVLSVEQDGNTLVVRYRDGVIHVLVPTDDGLATIYVARAAGARPVVSKVQEGESALDALVRLTRGAS